MKKMILIICAGVFSMSIQAQSRSLEEKLNEEYCTGLFKSTDGTILEVAGNSSAGSYFNILDWLDGRIAGLQVYKSRGKSIPVIRGGVPAIFVDEVQVSSSYLNSVNVHDIAIIKIIRTPFFGGFNASNGAIAIYTLGSEEDEEGSGSSK